MPKFSGDQTFYPRTNWFIQNPKTLDDAVKHGIGANMFKSYEFWKSAIPEIKGTPNTITWQLWAHYYMCDSREFASYNYLFGNTCTEFHSKDAETFLQEQNAKVSTNRFLAHVHITARAYSMEDSNQPLPLFYLLPLVTNSDGIIHILQNAPQISQDFFERAFTKYWHTNGHKGEIDQMLLGSHSPLTYFKITLDQLPQLLPNYEVIERYTSTVIRPKNLKKIEQIKHELQTI